MKLKLGFSPCPNDTFIFDALVHQQIDTEDIEFDVVLADVQTLNEWAMDGRLDVSKISYGVLPLLMEHYVLLNSGGALGQGVGPLLISRPGFDISRVDEASVAIPGEHTTAHLLFSLAFPNALHKRFMVFNEIEDAVLGGQVDAGVIIHENRFTYQLKGLEKLVDLGEYWERTTALPIPLGGIVARKSFEERLTVKIDRLIRRSVEYSFRNHYENLSGYVKQHAQEMSEDIMRQHIRLYVNDYSIDLGDEGKKAVGKLFEIYQRLHPGLPVANV
jgi:1,4-dihydroxy-6-naphthoate synthase